jgi:tetratricopeptide (TPR) repeat protein
MSRRLSDSAERRFQKVLSLIQKGKSVEALKELEKAEEAAKLRLKDPENEFYQTNLQMNFTNVFNLGYFLQSTGRFSQAQNFYELSLLLSQKLLKSDSEKFTCQSNIATIFNNLGVLFWNIGRMEDAKDRYEKALEMRQNLLKSNPENVIYQSICCRNTRELSMIF